MILEYYNRANHKRTQTAKANLQTAKQPAKQTFEPQKQQKQQDEL